MKNEKNTSNALFIIFFFASSDVYDDYAPLYYFFDFFNITFVYDQ